MVTNSCPADTTRLKRRFRSLCSRAENAEPEWLMNDDAAGGEVLRLVEAARAQPPLEVEEPHAVAAAQRHAGLAGDRGQPRRQRRDALARLLVPAREDDGRARAGRGGGGQLFLEGRVRQAEDGEVDRHRHGRDRLVARVAEDLGVPGVDREDPALEPALDQLEHHALAERSLARARAHDGDRLGLEHGLDRGPLVAVHRRLRLGLGAHPFRRENRLARFWSAMICLKQFRAGMPVTPPPPWVAELAWYRPGMGER